MTSRATAPTSGPSPRARCRATFTIDPDGDGPAAPFTLADPDFNLKSFRLNTILRWEWRPGSTLFFVWTESRRDDTRPGTFAFRRDVGDLFGADPDDVLMLKATWWIGRLTGRPRSWTALNGRRRPDVREPGR